MNLSKCAVALVAVVVAKSDPVNRIVGCGPQPGRVHRVSGRYADPKEQPERAQKLKNRLGHAITMVRAYLGALKIKLTFKRTYPQNMYQPSGWRKIILPSPGLGNRPADLCSSTKRSSKLDNELHARAPILVKKATIKVAISSARKRATQEGVLIRL